MHNMDRPTVTRLVYQRLADPSFRRSLTAVAPDGSRPIIVALRDDPMRSLLDRLRAADGAANVVVPALNGFIVVAMIDEPEDDASADANVQVISADCTVGVFVERLHIDEGTAVYRLPTRDADPSPHGGRAKVVALGG